jgi:hypothetical protein
MGARLLNKRNLLRVSSCVVSITLGAQRILQPQVSGKLDCER